MPERFDIVVAGAGHNSLITAAYLAKAGYRCLVLEGRPIAGGGVKSAELTLRGFQHDVCSSAHNVIHDNPMLRDDELKLGEFAKFSKNDGLAYRRMITEYEQVKPIFEANTFTPVGFGKPVNEQLAQHPHGKLWQRRLAMSVWEIVRDTFEDD